MLGTPAVRKKAFGSVTRWGGCNKQSAGPNKVSFIQRARKKALRDGANGQDRQKLLANNRALAVSLQNAKGEIVELKRIVLEKDGEIQELNEKLGSLRAIEADFHKQLQDMLLKKEKEVRQRITSALELMGRASDEMMGGLKGLQGSTGGRPAVAMGGEAEVTSVDERNVGRRRKKTSACKVGQPTNLEFTDQAPEYSLTRTVDLLEPVDEGNENTDGGKGDCSPKKRRSTSIFSTIPHKRTSFRLREPNDGILYQHSSSATSHEDLGEDDGTLSKKTEDPSRPEVSWDAAKVDMQELDNRRSEGGKNISSGKPEVESGSSVAQLPRVRTENRRVTFVVEQGRSVLDGEVDHSKTDEHSQKIDQTRNEADISSIPKLAKKIPRSQVSDAHVKPGSRLGARPKSWGNKKKENTKVVNVGPPIPETEEVDLADLVPPSVAKTIPSTPKLLKKPEEIMKGPHYEIMDKIFEKSGDSPPIKPIKESVPDARDSLESAKPDPAPEEPPHAGFGLTEKDAPESKTVLKDSNMNSLSSPERARSVKAEGERGPKQLLVTEPGMEEEESCHTKAVSSDCTEGDQMSRRSSRAKAVSYKEPSLNKKMRRNF